MAHKKGLGSSRNGRDSRAQRLGVKKFGGEIVKPGQIFNRIHVGDISRIVAATLDRTSESEIWNVADDEPAPQR